VIAALIIAVLCVPVAYIVGHDRGWRKGAAIAEHETHRAWSGALLDMEIARQTRAQSQQAQAQAELRNATRAADYAEYVKYPPGPL